MKKHNLKGIKIGFSLIEIMLVLSIVIVFTSFKLLEIQKETETLLSKNVAEQMKSVAAATNAYINLNYENLIALKSDAQSGLTCEASKQLCNLTLSTLKKSHLLPNAVNNKSLLGPDYKIVLKRDGVAPNYMINGLVYMDEPAKKDSKNSYDKIFNGMVLQQAGPDAGIIENNKINGYKGSWLANVSSYGIPNKNGLLGMNVGYSANMYSVYLRRDGTLPMMGNLNLGNNDINNAKNITSTGVINSNKLVVNKANSKDLTSDNIKTNTSLTANGLNVLNGQTTINGEYFNVNSNSTIFTKDVAIKGDLKVDKTAQFDGFAKFNGSILASNSTADLGTLKVNDALTVKGNSNLEGEVTMGVFGKDVKAADGNLTAKGNLEASLLIPKSTVVLGAVCQPKGAIAQDNIGSLLSCQNGKWNAIKAKTEFYVADRRRCFTSNLVTGGCSCSSGKTAVAIGSMSYGGGGNGANGNDNTEYKTSYLCR